MGASVFPDSIDRRIFFSDIKLNQKSIMDNYYKLLSEGKYTQASDVIKASDVSFLGKDVLDTIEDMIVKIEQRLQTTTYSNSTYWCLNDTFDGQAGDVWIN